MISRYKIKSSIYYIYVLIAISGVSTLILLTQSLYKQNGNVSNLNSILLISWTIIVTFLAYFRRDFDLFKILYYFVFYLFILRWSNSLQIILQSPRGIGETTDLNVYYNLVKEVGALSLSFDLDIFSSYPKLYFMIISLFQNLFLDDLPLVYRLFDFLTLISGPVIAYKIVKYDFGKKVAVPVYILFSITYFNEYPWKIFVYQLTSVIVISLLYKTYSINNAHFVMSLKRSLYFYFFILGTLTFMYSLPIFFASPFLAAILFKIRDFKIQFFACISFLIPSSLYFMQSVKLNFLQLNFLQFLNFHLDAIYIFMILVIVSTLFYILFTKYFLFRVSLIPLLILFLFVSYRPFDSFTIIQEINTGLLNIPYVLILLLSTICVYIFGLSNIQSKSYLSMTLIVVILIIFIHIILVSKYILFNDFVFYNRFYFLFIHIFMVLFCFFLFILLDTSVVNANLVQIESKESRFTLILLLFLSLCIIINNQSKILDYSENRGNIYDYSRENLLR